MSFREEKVEKIRKTLYEAPKFEVCSLHKLPKMMFCSDRSCSEKTLMCKDCRHEHSLANVSKIVPLLSQWVSKQWEEVSKEDRSIDEDSRTAETNVRYCIDILNDLLKQIQSNREGKHPP